MKHHPKVELSPLASQLYEAHVSFLLNQCSGDTWLQQVEAEITALRSVLEQVTLNQLINKKDLLATIQTVLVDYPIDRSEIAKHRHDLFLDVQKTILHAEINTQTHLSDVFSKKQNQQLVEKIIDLSELREQIISALLNSSIYVQLVSDVLYNGIKDFMLEENFLAKMPGVSTMLKMSKWSLSKTLPNLDTFVEKTAKDFIKQHIPKTVELSERILNKSLSGDSIRQVAEHIWSQVHHKTLDSAQDYIRDQDLVDFVTLSEAFWFHYRKSAHFIEICSVFIEYWLEKHGERTPVSFFDSLGGDTSLLIQELKRHSLHWIQVAKEQGYLEQRIRAGLAPFYQSKQVTQLLAVAESER